MERNLGSGMMSTSKQLSFRDHLPAEIIMITFTIIVLGIVLLLVAAAGLLRAVNHAPEGYEDELGFHEGIAPQPVEVATTEVSVQSSDSADPGWIGNALPPYQSVHKTPAGVY